MAVDLTAVNVFNEVVEDSLRVAFGQNLNQGDVITSVGSNGDPAYIQGFTPKNGNIYYPTFIEYDKAVVFDPDNERWERNGEKFTDQLLDFYGQIQYRASSGSDENLSETEKNKICSICQDSINLTASILKCGHIFHENCIDRWVDSDGKNCPICRDNLYSCNSCNGYGFTILNYEGVVIPVNLRGNILNRNHTDGIFGIYGHDFENLFLKSLFFDRINRRLYIGIIS